MTLASASENKEIYRTMHDKIIEKRFLSESPIRRFAHESQYYAFVDLIPAGSTVLDAGCGEGVLSVLLAEKGCIVTGFDISEPNIAAARAYAQSKGLGSAITFSLGDIEKIPGDTLFDYVVSSHVLEHVPDFVKGASELARLARKQVIIAIPTCLNLSAMVLNAHDKYWTLSRKSLYAIPYGMLRTVWAFVTNLDGVNEGYVGKPELIHIWRFPWKGRKSIEKGGLKVIAYRGSAYIFPYFSFLLPVARLLARMCWWPVIRNFGYGTTYVCIPKQHSIASVS